MDIETTGAVKLFFPNPSLALVYFEAVANALDAGATEISIDVEIEAFEKPETLIVTISDNGDGFTDENFSRFTTLLKPRDKYHKGIGRLVFLNYFNCVEIESIWDVNQRSFKFRDGFDGRAPIQRLQDRQPNRTTLKFSGFIKERIKAYNDLKPNFLKGRIIEQFLPTLYTFKRDGKPFSISINLTTNEDNAQKDFFPGSVIITPDDLPSMTKKTIRDESLDGISTIDMYYHIEELGAGKGSSLTAFSIDGRTIPANLIASSSFPHDHFCVFLFASELFHSNSDSSRQKLVLPENIEEEDLCRVLRREMGMVLSECIPEISEKNEKVKTEFEEVFPHLLGYFEKDSVGIIDKDDAIKNAQQRFFKDQREILQAVTLSESAYKKSLEHSSRALTEYILYRSKIIGRLKAMTEDNAESDIHNLIVPQYNEYNQENLPSDVYQNNAWLLDDKFMVFRTILSEDRMDNIIQAIKLDDDKVDASGRPDLAMIFSADPEDEKPVDVVIVEIKKKTDDTKVNLYAIDQLLDRAMLLAKHCHNIQRIWYYAVIQVNDKLEERLIQRKYTPLFSMGRVYYQEYPTARPDNTIVPTPIFVVSFDAIVADAESRNHTFLEILRDGMRKYAEAQE